MVKLLDTQCDFRVWGKVCAAPRRRKYSLQKEVHEAKSEGVGFCISEFGKEHYENLNFLTTSNISNNKKITNNIINKMQIHHIFR